MRTRTVLLAASAFWAAFALFVATELYLMVLDHGHSYVRMATWQVLAWQPWALLTPLFLKFTRRVPLLPPTGPAVAAHSLAALVTSTLHVAYYIALQLLLRPYDVMNPTEFMPTFLGSLSRLHSDVVVYLAIICVLQAADFYFRYREREMQAARLESSLAQARLEALQLQLHPHFLFNTLHSIGGLVRQGRGETALEMLNGLGELLRSSLAEQSTEVPLRRELELTDRYLQIHQVRFSDRLTVTVEVDEEARGARVPPLLLQPLVENAIQHGIARDPGPGRLQIRARREGGRLLIDVFNSGAGVERDRRGVGLRNTEERLRRLYGSEQELTLQDAPGGVRASVSIPFRLAEETA